MAQSSSIAKSAAETVDFVQSADMLTPVNHGSVISCSHLIFDTTPEINGVWSSDEEEEFVFRAPKKSSKINNMSYASVPYTYEKGGVSKTTNIRVELVKPFDLHMEDPAPKVIPPHQLLPKIDMVEPVIIAKPIAEPIAEPTVEPVAEPVAKPIAKPTVEPVAELVAKPIADPISEPGAEPVAKPEVVAPVDHVLSNSTATKGPSTVWDLFRSSYAHRKPVIDAIQNVSSKEEVTSEEIIAHINSFGDRSSITFTDKDLPTFGSNHNLPLHVTVQVNAKTLPIVLLDDGSAVNVLPLSTARQLGIQDADLTPNNMGVRAFDGSKRNVKGTINLPVRTGPIETTVEFQVLDINTSYNMLLGRPWIHSTRAVTSTLHQKAKIPFNGKVVTIPASTFRGKIEESSNIEATNDLDDDLCAFDFFINMIEVESGFGAFANEIVCSIMTKYGYVWGDDINPKRKSIKISYPKNPSRRGVNYGVGYFPTKEETDAIKNALKKPDCVLTEEETDPNNTQEPPHNTVEPTIKGLYDYFVKGGTVNPENSINDQIDSITIFDDCFAIGEESNPKVKPTEALLGGTIIAQQFDPEMINTIMRDQSFNPCDFITNADEKTVRGWRKTVKWTKDGRTFELTTGEGPMFENPEDEDDQDQLP